MIVVVFLSVMVAGCYILFSLVRYKKRKELIKGMGFSKAEGDMFSVENISVKGWRAGGGFEKFSDEGVYGISDMWVFKGVGRYSGVSQVTVLYFFCADWSDGFEIRRKRPFETKWEKRDYRSFNKFPDILFCGIGEAEAEKVLESFSGLSFLGGDLIIKAVPGCVFSYFEGSYIKNHKIKRALNEFFHGVNLYARSKK